LGRSYLPIRERQWRIVAYVDEQQPLVIKRRVQLRVVLRDGQMLRCFRAAENIDDYDIEFLAVELVGQDLAGVGDNCFEGTICRQRELRQHEIEKLPLDVDGHMRTCWKDYAGPTGEGKRPSA